MPTDNTTRQAQFLDERREEAAQEEDGRGDGEREERNAKKIKIELNGCWVDVKVDLTSLRAALGLPQHDIFDSGIYHDYVHHETAGPDVEDTDHGAVQPEQLPPIAHPAPTTEALREDLNAV